MHFGSIVRQNTGRRYTEYVSNDKRFLSIITIISVTQRDIPTQIFLQLNIPKFCKFIILYISVKIKIAITKMCV